MFPQESGSLPRPAAATSSSITSPSRSVRSRICERVDGRRADPDRLVGLAIESINQAVAMSARRRRRRAHVPRNFRGHYLGQGGYESSRNGSSPTSAATSCSNTTRRAPAISSRYAFVPKNKGVVLGLVSSKSPRSRAGTLERRPRRPPTTATMTARHRPQRGTASTAAGNPLTRGDQAETSTGGRGGAGDVAVSLDNPRDTKQPPPSIRSCS